MARIYAGEKPHFPSFPRVSTFKVYAGGKTFTDYSLIIVVEIYVIFRSELIRQMTSGPTHLVLMGQMTNQA